MDGSLFYAQILDVQQEYYGKTEKEEHELLCG